MPKFYVKLVNGAIDWTSFDSSPKEGYLELPEGDRDCMSVVIDGNGVQSIVLDQNLVNQKTINKMKADYAAQKMAEYEDFSISLMGQNSKEYVLAQAAYSLFLYLRAFQENINFADADLGPYGQAGKTALTQMEQAIFLPIKAKKDEITAAIAAYNPQV